MNLAASAAQYLTYDNNNNNRKIAKSVNSMDGRTTVDGIAAVLFGEAANLASQVVIHLQVMMVAGMAGTITIIGMIIMMIGKDGIRANLASPEVVVVEEDGMDGVLLLLLHTVGGAQEKVASLAVVVAEDGMAGVIILLLNGVNLANLEVEEGGMDLQPHGVLDHGVLGHGATGKVARVVVVVEDGTAHHGVETENLASPSLQSPSHRKDIGCGFLHHLRQNLNQHPSLFPNQHASQQANQQGSPSSHHLLLLQNRSLHRLHRSQSQSPSLHWVQSASRKERRFHVMVIPEITVLFQAFCTLLKRILVILPTKY